LGAEQDEALELAVLLLLEKLAPTERAAYILREAFDYSYEQIADVLHLSEDKARQLVSSEEKAVMEFFQTSTRNLLAYEAKAGVRHHVALSVVGTNRLQESAYIRAKIAQEKLIKESGIPYSIVRATQFFEFVQTIADTATEGNQVRLPPVFIQPIAAED
jgi:uncharacterized protein YbjT (DUF2867 family)